MAESTEGAATKRCSKCKVEKPLDEFHVRRASKDGLALKCRACVKAYDAAYRQSSAEVIAERKRQSYARDKERIRAYRQRNAKQIAERAREYRRANAERIAEYWREYRAANAERAAARDRRTKHKDWGFDEKDWQAALSLAFGECDLCGKPAKRLQIEHDHETDELRGAVHRACNSRLANYGDDRAGVLAALAAGKPMAAEALAYLLSVDVRAEARSSLRALCSPSAEEDAA